MKIEKELISVIVPIFRIEKYLGLCIESLIRQTYSNLEIILVDDGSDDRCPEICNLYAKKDCRIKVVHKENGGLVSARKAGLKVASGNVIGYVDGDDWVGPGFYESLYTEMVTSDSDIAMAGFSRDLFEQNVQFCNYIPLGIYEGERIEWLQNNMLSYGDFFRHGVTTYVWNKLFKKEVLWDCQMNVDERITIGEDGAVTYPAILRSKRVCITDNVAYHYRQREDSMLKKIASFETDAFKLKCLYEYLIGIDLPDKKMVCSWRKQVDDYVLGNCIMRSGGRIPGLSDSFSAFSPVYFGKKVVIMGAGTFGQQLNNRISEVGLCEIVSWVDIDYWQYRRCCMDVDPIESISGIDYDYILVATIDSDAAKSRLKKILDFGISKNKILLVDCPEENRNMWIRKYLY